MRAIRTATTTTALPTLRKCRRKHEPRRVREHTRPFSYFPRNLYPRLPHAYRLGPRCVETQEIAALIIHIFILTIVDTLVQARLISVESRGKSEGLE